MVYLRSHARIGKRTDALVCWASVNLGYTTLEGKLLKSLSYHLISPYNFVSPAVGIDVNVTHL